MKKIITIGRGEEADIHIDDELVSRRHATIKFLPLGKMEIRDLSKNGTFVNGIRLAVNKPCPVTRKDVVSFARVRQLDWSEVPDPTKPYRIGAIVALVIIVVLVVFSLLARIDWGGKDKPNRDMIEQYDEPRQSDNKEKEKDKDKEDAKPGEKQADKDGSKAIPNLFPKKDKPKSSDKPKDKADDKKGSKDSKDKKDSEKKEPEQPTHWNM